MHAKMARSAPNFENNCAPPMNPRTAMVHLEAGGADSTALLNCANRPRLRGITYHFDDGESAKERIVTGRPLPFRSVLPQHADDAALDLYFVRWKDNRRHFRVRGL